VGVPPLEVKLPDTVKLFVVAHLAAKSNKCGSGTLVVVFGLYPVRTSYYVRISGFVYDPPKKFARVPESPPLPYRVDNRRNKHLSQNRKFLNPINI